MTMTATALRRLTILGSKPDVLIALQVAVLTPLLGAAVGVGRWVTVVALVVLTLAFVVGMTDWRRPVYGLLLYLPFSGIPYVLLYPNVRASTLLKDALFVIPAYAGFVMRSASRRRRVDGRPIPGVPLALFATVVVVQIFNPASPGRLVGTIGAKVWLFYVPLCYLGYHLVEDRGQLAKLLGLMSAVAVVPAVVGIAEAVLIYSGHRDLVYGWYGGAAASVTQGFAEFSLSGGGSLRRVPSTFSFVAQYFSFTVSMVTVTYAWWRGGLAGTRSALGGLGGAVWLLLLLAGLLSGARAAFLFLPFLVTLILVLEGRTARFAFARLVAPAALLLGVAAAVLGTTAGGVLGHATQVGLGEFGDVFVIGFHQGFARTLVGLGTGVDTNAARYALGQTGRFAGVDGTWYESWYVKTLLELGIAGLAILALLLGTLVTKAIRQHARLRDPALKAISASLLGLLIWNIVFNIKAQYMDIDPMNVYFWLLLGLLFKLPTLDAIAPSTAIRPLEEN
jgi:hypothetical protein